MIDAHGNTYTVEPSKEFPGNFEWVLTDPQGEEIDRNGYFDSEAAAWADACDPDAF